MAGVDRQVPLNVPIVASEGRIPGGVILLLSGFLALLAYGAWYYLADRPPAKGEGEKGRGRGKDRALRPLPEHTRA